MSAETEWLYSYRSNLLTPEQWDALDSVKEEGRELRRLAPHELFSKAPICLRADWCEAHAATLTAAGLPSRAVGPGEVEANHGARWAPVFSGVLVLERIVIAYSWPGITYCEARPV